MEFTEEQQDIFNSYKKRENIFITGPGGCGKSFIIKYIVKDACHNNIKVSVCAMTGCAAILLNCCATTLHRWSGIGIDYSNPQKVYERIKRNRYLFNQWKNIQLLIIDEVSMMSKEIFELLHFIAQKIRKNEEYFGGIQLICSGDFYQLAPIDKNKNVEYCFESPLWNNTFDSQILMDTVIRQKDKKFLTILNEVRTGSLSPKTIKRLKKRIIDKETMERLMTNESIKPILLTPIKSKVADINQYELSKLSDQMNYSYTYSFQYTKPQIQSSDNSLYMKMQMLHHKIPTNTELKKEEEYMLKNSMFEKELILYVGSQVMCIANVDLEKGICNGTTGIVCAFNETKPIVRLSNGNVYTFKQHTWYSDNIPGAYITQYPLVLAWAITIHKSQGSTLENAIVDIGNSVFSEGQTYVALSRLRSLDGLYLTSFDASKIKINKKVQQFYSQFYEEETM